MKKLVWIFFVFVNGICYSQNPLNDYYRQLGAPDEAHKDYYPNGQLQCSYLKSNGNLEGEHANYFKNGKPMEICNFENGHLHGSSKDYNAKGQLIIDEIYTHDTLLFFKQIEYYKNEQIKRERFLYFDKDSLKINPFIKTKYHSLKNLIDYDESLSIAKMKSHGKWLEYFTNGKIKYEAILINNLREGDAKDYNDDGTLACIGPYHNDLPNGIFTYYSRKGEITKTEEWVNGKRQEQK